MYFLLQIHLQIVFYELFFKDVYMFIAYIILIILIVFYNTKSTKKINIALQYLSVLNANYFS